MYTRVSAKFNTIDFSIPYFVFTIHILSIYYYVMVLNKEIKIEKNRIKDKGKNIKIISN